MSLDACASLVERGDPDRFLAAMAAPPAARAKLFPLYAFNIEVARAPWVTAESMIAEMRLQWWRDVVEEIGAGKLPRAHEVVGPLAGVIQAADLPVTPLDALIAARRWDIYKDPFEDEAHFTEYLDATSGHLMWLAAQALGAEARLEDAVRQVALAAGIANWLLAVPELEARGRVPLLDGRPEGVRALASRGLNALEDLHGVDFGVAVPALRAGWRARHLLTRAVRDPGLVGAGALGGSEMRRRGSLLLRTMTRRW